MTPCHRPSQNPAAPGPGVCAAGSAWAAQALRARAVTTATPTRTTRRRAGETAQDMGPTSAASTAEPGPGPPVRRSRLVTGTGMVHDRAVTELRRTMTRELWDAVH